MRSQKSREVAWTGMLFALAIALSFLESAITPLLGLMPAMKLGLSNIVVMYALLFLRTRMAMLLVVPEKAARFGIDYTLAPGDRLCLGVGPAVSWADWPGFVPAARSDTVVVQYVLPMRRRGRPHHVEAGAWWSAGGTGVRSLTR